MSSQPSPDFNYLQGTVGEALARGCAAVAAAQPSDPVDYLGHWLLRCGRRNRNMHATHPQRLLAR